MTSTFDKGNTYTTPKAHIADMSTFEGTEKKRRTTPKGIDGEENNGRGREGSTPSHDTYRKRLYSQVVAEPSSANIGLGINAYDKTLKMVTPKYAENTHFKPPPPPPPYAPELPAPAVPAQHVQGRYFYGDIADPYSESYSNNFSDLNRREMYHKEMYQQETPSDFQDIQVAIAHKKSFWRRHPFPMFTFMFGFLVPPLWVIGAFWTFSKHKESKRWGIVNVVGVVSLLIAVIVIESLSLSGQI